MLRKLMQQGPNFREQPQILSQKQILKGLKMGYHIYIYLFSSLSNTIFTNSLVPIEWVVISVYIMLHIVNKCVRVSVWNIVNKTNGLWSLVSVISKVILCFTPHREMLDIDKVYIYFGSLPWVFRLNHWFLEYFWC